MDNEVETIAAGLPPVLAEGRVGLFWVVPGRSGQDKVLGDSLGLAKAELYGRALTHPDGHYDFWEAMKARGPAWLRNRGLSTQLLYSEYEDWPRGRIVFHLDKLRFALMADRRLHTPTHVALIAEEFCLPDCHFDVSGDGHYRPVSSAV